DIQLGITSVNPAVKFGGELAGRDFLGFEGALYRRDGPAHRLAHRSITLGTRKKGFAASGALASKGSATLHGSRTSSRSSGCFRAASGAAAEYVTCAIGSTFEMSRSFSLSM